MKKDLAKQKEPLWPKDGGGNPIPPAFLKRVYGGDFDLELTLNLLEAYGIPHVLEYPDNGMIGKIIAGFPGGGADIFVPQTMLEDAQNIINADEFDEDGDEAL